jgi:hypothetical protein
MDIFKFPLLAEIWGTVSDWVMIAVTSITAYFLWKTLKSQKEVQQAQNSLLKIEQLRFREDFKPNLKYSRAEVQMHIDEPDKKVICIVVRNISLNPALNVNANHNYEIDNKTKQIFFKPSIRTLTHDGKFLELYFIVNYKKDEHLNCQIYFTVEYEDVAGTKYGQMVIFDAFAGLEEFRTFDPQVTKELDL